MAFSTSRGVRPNVDRLFVFLAIRPVPCVFIFGAVRGVRAARALCGPRWTKLVMSECPSPLKPVGHQHGVLRLARVSPIDFRSAFVGEHHHAFYGFPEGRVGLGPV